MRIEPKQAISLPTRPRVEEHLVSLVQPRSFEAEQYRTLRQMLEVRHRADGLSIVAVSSPSVADGKTTTAINLAGALAQAEGSRVLLIDADLRRPAVAGLLGLGQQDVPGLAGAVKDPSLPWERVIDRLDEFNLSVITAGRSPDSPYELLQSSRMNDLMVEARRRYDYIIIDTPPLLSVPDCRLIEKWVDGFLVVVAAHRTPRKLVEESLNVIHPTKIVGLVLNKDDRPLSGYYGYYGRHYGPSSSRKLGR